MVDYPALAIKVPESNPLELITKAEGIRHLQTQNELSRLTAADKGMDLSARQRLEAGEDPTTATRGAPAMAHMLLQNRTLMNGNEKAEFDMKALKNATDARDVLSVPAGAERDAVWQDRLKRATDEGRLDPTRYATLSKQPPNDLMLHNLMMQGVTIEQQLGHEQKDKDRDLGKQVSGALGGLFGAPAAATGNDANLTKNESGNDPRRVNKLGYAGLYQFGAPRAETLGVYTPGENEDLKTWSKTPDTAPGKWSGQFNIPGFEGVKTLEDFRNNPAAQTAVFNIDKERKKKEITDNGFDKYIGKIVGGVPVTQEGLENAIHLGGVGGAQRFLSSNGRDNPDDANGTTVGDYMRMGARGANLPGPRQGDAATSAPGVQSTIGGVPAQNLAKLAAIAANPGIPKETKDVIMKFVEIASKESALTDMQKKYTTYAQQEVQANRVPKTILEYEKELAESGSAKPDPGENEYSKKTGAAFAEINKSFIESENKAHTQLRTLDRMEELISDPKVYTGTGAELVTELKRAAKSVFNMDLGGVGPAEAVRAIANQFALQLRNPEGGAGMPGALSDKDLAFLKQSVPGLLVTKEGNKLLIEFMRKSSQEQIELNKERHRLVQANPKKQLGEDEMRKLQDWRNSKHVFVDVDGAGGVKVKPELAAALEAAKKGSPVEASSMTLPVSDDGKINPAQLKSGQKYDTPKGPATWDGSQFVVTP